MSSDEVVYRMEVRFNAIYVIESLPLKDAKTGRDLYDEVIYPSTVQLPEIHTEFIRVQSAQEFAAALAVVARNAILYKHLPILHLEMHGSDTGIGFADDTH